MHFWPGFGPFLSIITGSNFWVFLEGFVWVRSLVLADKPVFELPSSKFDLSSLKQFEIGYNTSLK